MKIFIIDDDSNMSEVLAILLNNRGHEVMTASSGMNAVALLAPVAGSAPLFSPEVAVVDFHMDGMDGVETVKELRASGHRFPVVFHSGDATTKEIDLMSELSRHFVYKPARPEILIGALEDAIKDGIYPKVI